MILANVDLSNIDLTHSFVVDFCQHKTKRENLQHAYDFVTALAESYPAWEWLHSPSEKGYQITVIPHESVAMAIKYRWMHLLREMMQDLPVEKPLEGKKPT